MPETPDTADEQPALLDIGPADAPAFATLVSNDGRKPVTLDRWQSIALRAAFAELGA
jgi:hypothetical protein